MNATHVSIQIGNQMRALRAHACVRKITQNSLCHSHVRNVMLHEPPDSELTTMSVIPVVMAITNKAVFLNEKILALRTNLKTQLQIIVIQHYLERRNAIRVQVLLMMNELVELLETTRLTLVILSAAVERQNAKNEMGVLVMIEQFEPSTSPCSSVQIHVERLDQIYIMMIQQDEYERTVMLLVPPVMDLIRLIVSPDVTLTQWSMGQLIYAHEILTIIIVHRHPRYNASNATHTEKSARLIHETRDNNVEADFICRHP